MKRTPRKSQTTQKPSGSQTGNDPEETFKSLNTRIFWALIAAFVFVDAVGIAFEGMSVVPDALWDMVWRMVVLLALSLFYTYFRPDVRLATLMHAIAMFAASATPISVFYYVAMAWHAPLVDAHLAAADHALGLNWVATYEWVATHPLLRMTLSMAYFSLLPQAIVLIVLLNFLGKSDRCWEIPWLLLVSAIVAFPFTVLSPAVGTFGYFHINEKEPYLTTLQALHDGTFRDIDFRTMQGVVTFPSFHAASAIMLAYAARGTFVFPLLLVLNILMFLATPTVGGHYFVDLWGGAALALITILVVRRYCGNLISAMPLSETSTQELPAS